MNLSLRLFRLRPVTNLESVVFTNSSSLLQSKALSADRKAHFEEEIKMLSGALKAQYDQANKEYEGLDFT